MNPGPRPHNTLLHLALSHHARVELDLPKRAFIASDILLQNRHERLGLLWAQINSLKIAHLDLRLALLLQGTKNQEKIPNVHAHLHAVGIALAVIVCINQLDIGLCRDCHKAISLSGVRREGKRVALRREINRSASSLGVMVRKEDSPPWFSPLWKFSSKVGFLGRLSVKSMLTCLSVRNH